MKRTMAMVAVAGLMVATSAQAESAKGDPAKAQQIVTQVCAACHGADGNSTSAANPKLAGQHAEYITKQLMNFKSGERKSAVMSGMVASLSPQDMVNLGAYFSEKTIKPGAAKDKDLAALGEKIYRGGNAASGVPACMACHGPSGAGIPVQFPRLGGQHSEYVLTQLKNFRSGDRANDGGKMMRVIAEKLTDQEMKAVSEYVAGLH
jgi:cytochrome c553